jgi:diaminohydroxyphosphoribosylaminopyrimidine deaminase/5-amino-6-(5-phosphoribosylamino)uracil reductase
MVDAVVVSTGTVLADDPALTARESDDSLCARQPLRVVVGHREVPTDARVRSPGGQLVTVPSHSPDSVLRDLFERGVHHVMLEAGPTMVTAWISANVVDEAIGFIAPALLGTGPTLVGDLGIANVEKALRFEFSDVRRVGGDIAWRAAFSNVGREWHKQESGAFVRAAASTMEHT